MQSLIPCQLSQRQVRLHVDWVNPEWGSPSTESTRNEEIFLNVGAFCVDLVDMYCSLTPHPLSVRKMNQAKTGTYNQLWGF